MQTSEVLNRAADLIEERGWANRDVDSAAAWGRESDTSPVCLEGGIMAAVGIEWSHDVQFCPAYKAVHEYLGFREFQRLYEFNDKMGRTATEVIAVLRATALIESAREEQDAAWETYAEVVTA